MVMANFFYKIQQINFFQEASTLLVCIYERTDKYGWEKGVRLEF